MRRDDFFSRFRLDLDVAAQASHNPYYHLVQSALTDELTLDGDRFIDLASNNYLGVANHPNVVKACKEAVDAYGASLCATPIASGYTDLHQRVEQKLADFTGTEAALVYPSCYQANLGLFRAIAKPADVVLVDRCVHSSLLEGIKGVGCKMWPFKHNDMDYLERLLKQSSAHATVFVVTESVFSTEGTVARFADIVELCNAYDAIPVVDDSHGIGVLGPNGRGILEHAGIHGYQGIYTASLGKALANMGGMVAGKASWVQWMKYYSSHLVYSTAVVPSALAGIEAVVDLLRDSFCTLGPQMWQAKQRIENALLAAGFAVTRGEAPITSIKSGNSVNTLRLAKLFWEHHILTTPFVYPSVPLNEGRIRLIAGAHMRDETLQRVEQAIAVIGQKLNGLHDDLQLRVSSSKLRVLGSEEVVGYWLLAFFQEAARKQLPAPSSPPFQGGVPEGGVVSSHSFCLSSLTANH